MGARRGEVGRISGEQARLRENMKALKGSAEEKALVQRYVQDLNKQEDRLVVLNREIGDLESQTRKLGAELDLMVQSITFDEDI
jgi:glutathione synthase/RimK-type ligase-like ATP-grasp enzyme